MVDYPDFEDHVERSPIHATIDQIWGAVDSGLVSIPARSSMYLYFVVPNDGYHYVIDTVFFHYFIIGPAECSVLYCLDYGAPSWIKLAITDQDWSSAIVISKLGAFDLIYPQAVSALIFNHNGIAKVGRVFLTYYKYYQNV